MEGLIDGGDDDALHDHNDNIYQAYCLIFIAALSVNLGKVRWQPADAEDEMDLEIAKKGSTIQAYNERVNDEEALKQLMLLYLWTTGSFWRHVGYKIDKNKAGTRQIPKVAIRPVQVSPAGYVSPR